MRPAPDAKDFRRDLAGLLPRLRRFAMTLTRDARAADALVQEVCGRAIAQADGWDGRGRLEGWIYGLARMVFSQDNAAWREDLKERAASDGFKGDAQDHSSEIRALILAMPAGYASTFLLVDVEHYTYAETAAILDMTPETVVRTLCAARLRLAAMTAASTIRRA